MVALPGELFECSETSGRVVVLVGVTAFTLARWAVHWLAGAAFHCEFCVSVEVYGDGFDPSSLAGSAAGLVGVGAAQVFDGGGGAFASGFYEPVDCFRCPPVPPYVDDFL